jgi:hypothetical protein
MTTPEPRVRVAAPVHVTKIAACDTYWGEPAWAAGCRECGQWVAGPRLTWGGAVNDALHHDCAGVRLARLLRELKALRDGWTSRALYVDGSLLPPVSVERRIYQRAADDLAAILARAAGGTG